MTLAEVWLLQRQGYEHRVPAPFNDLQAETSLWQRAMGERNDFRLLNINVPPWPVLAQVGLRIASQGAGIFFESFCSAKREVCPSIGYPNHNLPN